MRSVSVRHISVDERHARLALRHRLVPGERSDDVAEVTDSLVALHSSDPASVYLSAIARMATPSLEAVSAALYDARSVVRHHGMRRTLWVMAPDAARAVYGACTAGLAVTEWTRMVKLVEDSGVAVDGAAWTAAARAETIRALRALGSATARRLGREIPDLQAAKLQLSPGKPYAGTQSAHTRVLQNLGFDGAIVRGGPSGSWIRGEYTWAVMDEWLPGGVIGMESRAAVAALVGRYLAAFGPVTTTDVRWWTGLTAGAVTTALADVGAVAVELDDGPAWVHPADVDPVAVEESWVALLPSLDPTTMGWKERGFTLGDLGGFEGPLFDRNGNAGPTVWMDGRVVGGWAQRPDGKVVVRTLVDIPRGRLAEITRAAARLGELLDGVAVNPRFQTLLQKELGHI